MVNELCQRLALRYTEFLMLLPEFLPEYSEMNPVHPSHMLWRQPTTLFELLRRDDARTPVTRAFLEEQRNVILDVVTEYNCNLRADLIQMVFEDPLGPAKPIAITEEKALEILKSASALFVKRDKYTELRMSRLYTYDGLIEEIRRDFHYDELVVRARYGGYDSFGWTDVLLEKLGLDGDVKWDLLEAKQLERPLVCLCGKPSFKQPASFIDLVSCCSAPPWGVRAQPLIDFWVAFTRVGGVRLVHRAVNDPLIGYLTTLELTRVDLSFRVAFSR